jgi:excisionase family DNA binding protein
MVKPMPLLRPSELARLWELHPKTVYAWIRDGKLPAIKTPGAQYRIRSDDARSYCEKNGLPLPRALRGLAVAAIGRPSPAQRAVAKACKAHGAELVLWPRALEGLLAVAREAPDVVVIDARLDDVDLADALRALRRTASTAAIPVVVHDAASRSAPLAKLGVALVPRGKSEDAAAAVSLALDSAPRRLGQNFTGRRGGREREV